MACNLCEDPDGTANAGIDDFPKVDHPINGQKTVMFGTVYEKQLYRCPYCEEFILATLTTYMTQKKTFNVKLVGWNPDGIGDREGE